MAADLSYPNIFQVRQDGNAVVPTGKSLDIESGGSLKIAGTAVTATAAELNAIAGNGLSAAELAVLDGVTAGTVTASKAVVVDANKDATTFRDIALRTATLSGNLIGSVAAPAAAGNAQGNGTALTADNNFVTGADGTKGVVLPTAVAGMRILVKSVTGGSVLKVYPASGGTINALAGDAAISMASLTAAIFVASSATQWYTCPLLPS